MSFPFFLISKTTHLAANFRLTSGSYLLGRSSQCDFVVHDLTISRKHAQLTVAKQGLEVIDLGSRNGCFVNDEDVKSCVLSPGQTVQFGGVVFLLSNRDVDDSEGETQSIPSSDVDQMMLKEKNLTKAQKRVFDLLADGIPEKEIAKKLFLSPHTVHNHVRAIYGELGVHSRAQFLARVLRKRSADQRKA